jgi:hypothetical protein
MTEQVKISTREELLNNKSTNIYYNMETYNPDELIGIVSIKFCDKIKLTSPLPDSIENIEFECYFDSVIENNILPKNLKTLNLGWYFNKEITDQNLPESVEELAFGRWFNKDLLLSLRNLKSIIVHTLYSCLVSQELMNIMPEYYIRNYPQIVKNQITPEMCYEIDEDKDDEDKDDEDEDKDDEDKDDEDKDNEDKDDEDKDNEDKDEDEIEYDINNEINNINEEIKKRFDKNKDKDTTLDGKNVFINQKNQIVIELVHSFWDSFHFIFVGNNDKFYRTYFSQNRVPRPHIPDTNTEKQGPFSIDEIFSHQI